MKKIIFVSIILIFLTGCGLFDLTDWVMPDDLEFLEVIESLDTPEKICAYIKEDFTYKEHLYYAPDPYTLWQLGEGDCNDFETFARFAANYHGYETYRLIIYFKNSLIKHALAVFKEYGGYTYQNIKAYKPIYADTFEEVADHWEKSQTECEVQKYKVYDYEMNLVETGNNN